MHAWMIKAHKRHHVINPDLSPRATGWRITSAQDTLWHSNAFLIHYDDVTMSLMASQITSLTIVYSIVYSGADQRKHQSSASLAFVQGIHRGPVNSPHKWPVTRKMFPFDDVIMYWPFVVGFTGKREIPFLKSGNVELWCFLCCKFQQALKQTVELPETP